MMTRIAAMVALMSVLGGSCVAQGTMTAVEPLTEIQQKRLADAYALIATAEDNLAKVQQQIADEHHFKSEHWMEWASWVEFDGKFIIFRTQNYMLPPTTTLTGPIK